MSAVTDDGLLANESFYRAFAGRDVEGMDEVWARRRASVACVHPWLAAPQRPLRGHGELARHPARPGVPDITCTDATCHISSATARSSSASSAWTSAALYATNVFVARTARGGSSIITRARSPTNGDDERPDPWRLN